MSEDRGGPRCSQTVVSSQPSKTLVRNCVSNPVVTFREPSETSDSSDSDDSWPIPDPPTDNLSEPQLLSTLKVVESLKNVSEKSCQKLKVKRAPPPKPNVPLKRTNIRFDEQIFKDLIDLKVNDEDIGIPPNAVLKAKEIQRQKEPEPVLSDYFKPDFSKEYVVKPPSFKLSTQKQRNFTGTAVFDVMKRWEASEET